MATQSIWGNDAIGGARPWQMQAMGSPGSSPWTQQLGDQSGMWGSPAAGQSPFSGMFSGGNSAQPASGDNPWASLMGGPSSNPWASYASGNPNQAMPAQQPANPYQTMPAGGAPPAAVPPTNQTELFGIGTSDPKTTQTTKIEPWGPQGDALKYLYGQGEANYKALQKQGPIGFDRASTVGLDRMQRLAGGPNPLVDSATGAVGDVASGDRAIRTGSQFGQIAQGPGISTGGFTSLYENPGVGTGKFNQLFNQNATGQGQLSQGIFGNIAQGGQLSAYPQYAPTYDEMGNPIADPRMAGIPSPGSDPNPYRSAALQDALTQTANQTKAGLSAAGRYGSSAYGDAMGKALGSAATNFNLNAYNADEDRMMQAAQAASGEQLARSGLGMQAAQGVAGAQGQNAATKLAAIQGSTGVQNQNTQNKLAALAGLTGVQGQNIGNQLQAAGMAPAMNDLRYADAQKLIGIGGAREEQAKQAQQFGSQNLAQLSGLFGGLPGSAGTSQTQTPKQPWWSALLGGGLAGLGALGGLFG